MTEYINHAIRPQNKANYSGGHHHSDTPKIEGRKQIQNCLPAAHAPAVDKNKKQRKSQGHHRHHYG